MSPFKSKLSLNKKILLIIIFICSIMLILSATMITLYEWKKLKESLISNMTSITKITSGNIQAAVMFKNATDADRILSEFKSEPRIVNAGIYLYDNTLFSEYNATNERLPSTFEYRNNELTYEFKNGKLHIYQPVSIQGEGNVIGSLYIISSLDLIYSQIRDNIIITFLIILLALLLAVILTAKTQRMISEPILSLSNTTKKIKNEKDYSIRVDHDEFLEIEELSDGFNAMLEEIQSRDENLQRLATYDELTNIPNRNYFIDLLNQAITRGNRKSQRHAVLFMDLDRFKNINDSLGHSKGDELLIKVAKRLNIIIRGDDIVARFGGDEFTFLLRDLPSSNQAAEVADRILEVLNEPFDMDNHNVVVVPSIGIVLFPDNGNTPEELLKNADTAMYRAKNSGGNKYLFFTDNMNKEAQLHQELEEALRNAIYNHEFILHYQPKFDLHSGKSLGMEALARWNRPNNGLVAPNLFIPIAEETGLIIPMGKQILDQAISQTKVLIDKHIFDGKLAVNISARQFEDKDLLNNIKSLLEKHNLSPENLEIELTEAAVMNETEDAISTLKEIRDAGISIAMDDFGTGYSSLSYLKKFPLNTLKIDMSFIRDMDQSEENKSIVKSIIDLSHILKLNVVAEGIETEEQAKILTDMGCDVAQGYYFSKPLDFNKISEFFGSSKIALNK
jgi:diguanylate cyclase (GGDEF)-like protein